MLNIYALPNVKRSTHANKTKATSPKEQSETAPSQASQPSASKTTKPSAALAKIYFGGVDLANAIQKSKHVAAAQQLKSVMSLQEYVNAVEDHPLLLRNTAQYAMDLIQREGVRKKTKYGRPILEYEFFSNPKNPELKGLKGNQGSINDVMLHIRAAAKRQDLGKKPIVLMGGPGSGKTSIGDVLVDGYARYSKTDEGARYATKLVDLPDDLRMGEEYVEETLADPLLFLTPDIRKAVVESAKPKFDHLKERALAEELPIGYERPNVYDYELGVEGDLTPKTQYVMKYLREMYLDKLIEESGVSREELETEPEQPRLVELKRQAYQQVLKNHLQTYRFEYNPNSVPGGVGVFSATDSKTLNTAKINGQVNMVRNMDLPESDPRRYDYIDGAAFRANRGVLRFKEMHKNPESFYPLLLDLAQSQLIEIDSGNATVNTLIVADSNFPELKEKRGKEVLDAALKRLDHVFVTHPLEWSAEKEIQDNLFADFEKNIDSDGQKGHVAPHTKDLASLWAVMTRLAVPDDKKAEGLDFLAKKAAAYDGRVVEGIEEQEVNEWYEKGQKADSIEEKEGMDGLSVREMQTIANLVTGDLNVRRLNSVDGYAYLHIAKDVLEKNRLSLSDDMKTKALDLLKVGETYLDDQVKGDVAEVLAGDKEYLQTLFKSYLNNAIADTRGQKIQDPLTHKLVPVDEELMQDIENRMGIRSRVERETYRKLLAARVGASRLEDRDYDLDSDPKLKKAIMGRAYAKAVDKIDAKVLLSTGQHNQRDAEQLNGILRGLMEKGYNRITARNALARVQMLSRRDSKLLESMGIGS